MTVFSQEHEKVVAFLNRGGSRFRREVVYTAPHPDWGCSGLEAVDLDGDGDPDLLLTNGDTFTSVLLRPQHGITWLENRGRFPFEAHRLASLYGVHRAEAADLDGDGDLDVVACAFLPYSETETVRRPFSLDALIWLEQVGKGRFVEHSLEKITAHHPTLALGDYDRDGDVDIVTGNYTLGIGDWDRLPDWVEIWENRRR